jgi:hypothetical protein
MLNSKYDFRRNGTSSKTWTSPSINSTTAHRFVIWQSIIIRRERDNYGAQYKQLVDRNTKQELVQNAKE